MQVTRTNLPKSEVELTIELSHEEIVHDLEAAAKRISEATKIDGFRPGNAPFDVVKQKVGEMAVWQEAAQDIVRHAFVKAILQENLSTVGQPEIDLVKFAPGNPLIFKAKVAILPAVLSLPDFTKLSVAKKPVEITNVEMDKALGELQKMQTQEVEVERAATGADKIVVDMQMLLDNVPLEGGHAKNHGVYLSEEAYVPGLTKELTGLKKGDEKSFTLVFPETHYQKNTAGKAVEFKVKVDAVFELQPPALDDAFASTLGQKSLEELKSLLKNNLQSEAEEKEAQRLELEMLDKVVEGTRFEDIPEAMITKETERMVRELSESLTERGMDFGEYLRNLKKTKQEVQLDFAPQATKRIKTAIMLREVGRKEKVEPDELKVMEMVTEAVNHYKDNPDAQKFVRSDEYMESVRERLRDRQTIEWLKSQIIK